MQAAMGERRRVTAAACCMLCLLCHQSARCLAQLTPENSNVDHTDHHQPLADENFWLGNTQVVTLLLHQYGDGKTISHSGFESLLSDLKLTVPSKLGDKQMLVASNNNSSQGSNNKPALAAQKEACEGITAARTYGQTISAEGVINVCPALLVKLIDPSLCPESPHDHHSYTNLHHPIETESESNTKAVWLYATGSIVVISACGLLAVAVIPIMQKLYYQQLLQFLVSLAVGSLCGDALLHLLPHAMSGGHSKGHHHDEGEDDVNLWRGFVALLGIVLFFFTEKCLTHIAEWKRRNQRKKKQAPANVKVMRDVELQGNSSVGEKLCKHKYSSYPYCYAEITGAATEEGEKKCADPAAEPPSEPIAGSSPVVPEAFPKEGREEEPEGGQAGEGFTVIVREHERTHHGHSHSHGHVHSAPHSLSAVAWMVVMGDGLHNLTDGLAIGAAFAASIPGGLSTALAVFCHELPHELGDFAVLLKAGMSAKQAVCYNLLSSVLCFLGMVLGISLGHSEETAQWVFAAAAGMFLYIALVDMIPELTSGHSEGTAGASCLPTLLLQLCGMTTGLTIMLIIALHEKTLHSIFCQDSEKTPCSIH